ncbi:hypothetical protein PR048_010232 [Dryococelus australis]|uniref:Uncharacterized protein n=1 Tax=Dryococelus australis TaxID=614101 RepID=A0ABQ9I462_9NEOP|nr:hypothetical protein PR048_010232 [Dryococelus australis]
MDGFNSAMFGQFSTSNPAAASDVSLPWLQKPPVQLPWVLPTNQYPDIVQFSAQHSVMPDGYASGSFSFQPSSPPQNAKRKSEWMEEDPCPKKLITEEKISGLLKEMHITKSASLPEQGTADPLTTSTVNEADVTKECPKQQLKRLVLCEEIRQFKNEPILPSSLLSKLSASSMSLVLWKPPPGQLSEILTQAVKNVNSSRTTSITSMDTEAEEEELCVSITEMQ